MNAIAAAAKKRAEKLGITNEEVDESNAGKNTDPGDLSHPFFGKLKQTGAAQLSPRSKRLVEMNKENEGSGDSAPAAQKAVPAAPPPKAAQAAQPPKVPPTPGAAASAKTVNIGAAWSEAAAAELKKTVESSLQQQQKDALSVMKRWAAG